MSVEWINDHGYTCPLLMAAQGVLLRQKWRYGSDGWTLLESPTSAARCVFPTWAVLTECRFWNSWAGIRVRQACGVQQREWRLKTVNAESPTW